MLAGQLQIPRESVVAPRSTLRVSTPGVERSAGRRQWGESLFCVLFSQKSVTKD